MKYLTEKDLLVQKIEGIIARELPNADRTDPELARLFLARKVLLGEADHLGIESGDKAVGRPVEVLNENLVDEFSKVSLRNELDLRKGFLGLIEVVTFILTVVTALSAKEASRSSRGH
jgi:hypothetical protein